MNIISKRKNYWTVALDKSEHLNTVVEAWARASFEMAKPAGISAITSFKPETRWLDVKEHTLKRRYPLADPHCVLEMDYVAGRRCKTTIRRGRKYLTIYPGDGREQEMETMYLLAMKYLMQIDRQLQNAIPQTKIIQ